MAAVTRYRLRTDGGTPSAPLTMSKVIALLRQKLSRHPAGRHYRVDGGPLRTRFEARVRARRHLRYTKLGDTVEVLVDISSQPRHSYTIRRVNLYVPDGGLAVVDWCQERIGTPYDTPGQVGDNASPMDCSGMTLSAVAHKTDGKVMLPHNAAAQWNDPRVIHIGLDKAKPGDLMFYHGLAHVAVFWQVDQDGVRWVLDEEPGTEVYNDVVIYGGLRARPCAQGYYVGIENLVGCGRIEAVNGPV